MRDLIRYIFTAILICSSLILVSYYYKEYRIAKTRKDLAEANRIVVEKEEYYSNSVIGGSSSIDEDYVVDYIDSDMKLKEVESYKNVIQIPQLDIEAVIFEGTSSYVLSVGVGHYEGTVAVGEFGNCAIAGHRSDSKNCIFNGLDTLRLLDEFYAYDEDGKKHTYTIVAKYIVEPEEIGVLSQGDKEHVKMTLTTCANNGMSRLIVEGIEFQTEDEKDYYVNNIEKIQVTRALAINDTITFYKEVKRSIPMPSPIAYTIDLPKSRGDATITVAHLKSCMLKEIEH